MTLLVRLTVLVACLTWGKTAAAQLANRATANWGTMPNGWVDHTGINPYRTAFGASQARNSFRRSWSGGYPTYRYGAGVPLYVNPGFAYGGIYGVPGYGWGYRCGRCLSPYCLDPFCQGVAVSGLSLSVYAPQLIVPRAVVPPIVAPQAVAPPIAAGADLGVFAAETTGLPWLDRLRREQAAAFAEQDRVAANNRDRAFQARIDPLHVAEIDADAAVLIRKRVAELKPSNQAGRERSDQLIVEADKFFSDQQFTKAAQRYRQAVAAAPNYPKALFRAAHYFMATGDYENSLLAYLMALEISKTIQQPGFRLDDLYRGNMLDKVAHIDRLAEASLNRPDDGGLLMLVGLTLYYDQQIDRSMGFFRSAAELEGPQSLYASWFLRSFSR